MKISTKVLYLLFFTVFFSCERDDLCPEDAQITPQLVIDFFDINNPSELLAPTNLLIIEEGTENSFAPSGTTIFVPLRTNVDQTRFLFVLNSTNEENDLTNPPNTCLLYTSPSPRDQRGSRMPSSA